jgi:hypothetical protein
MKEFKARVLLFFLLDYIFYCYIYPFSPAVMGFLLTKISKNLVKENFNALTIIWFLNLVLWCILMFLKIKYPAFMTIFLLGVIIGYVYR